MTAGWTQLAPRDAQMYWLTERIGNDQYLLYCFDGSHGTPESLRRLVARRSALIPDLCVKLREVPRNLDFPYWVPRPFGPDQIVEHQLPDSDWSGFTAAMGELLTDELDARSTPWRLHMFRDVAGAPWCESGVGSIAVLQISHALADGRQASTIARALFGSQDPPVPTVRRAPSRLPDGVLVARGLGRLPLRVAMTFVRGVQAFRAQREIERLTSAGELPAPTVGQQLTKVNSRPGPTRVVRMIVLPAAELRSSEVTVTIMVLTAISSALAEYLTGHGGTVDRLGAELPVASHPRANVKNNFRNVGVDLFPDEPDVVTRAQRIAAALAERRSRADNPLFAAQSRVGSVLAAPMLRHEVANYPFDDIPPTVSGNTVVSSVFRGAGDLELDGGTVRFTAGFPSLSPVMGLTHGIHGIGDTVTVTITTSPDVMPDVDDYEALLRRSIADVVGVFDERARGTRPSTEGVAMAATGEAELQELTASKGLVFAQSGTDEQPIYQLWEQFPQETVQAVGKVILSNATLSEAIRVARDYTKPAS
jgi:hypothetical protein